MDYSTKTLAKGCFGKVYKVDYKGNWAALKKVPVGLISTEQLNREFKVYKNAHHKNVVKLLEDPWMEDGKWHIPLEFIFGEDLETTIFNVQKSKIHLEPKVKATIITGMCEGLFYLHSKDIVHQDLKPDNIMVEHGTNRPVIIDMGLAKFSVNGLSSAQNLGNEAYSAPEILHENGIRDKRSDVWAMGKMIAELIARVRLPTIFVSPEKISETLKDNPYCNAVSKMVTTKPIERASMVGVISEIRRAGILFGVERGVKPVGVHERANANFGAQGDARGKMAINPVPHRRWHPTLEAPKAPVPEMPTVRINRSPSPQPQAVALISKDALITQFAQMAIPLPQDGTVIQRRYDGATGQLEVKEIVVKDGKIVKYDDVKITKS